MKAPPSISATKVCTRCGKRKPVTDFYVKKGKGGGQYRYGHCKACHQKITDQWRIDNREKFNTYMRRNAKKRRYGLTLEEYDARFVAVGFKCEVCLKPGRPDRYQDLAEGEVQLHLDHDHETGELRGILCTNCNNGLGRFEDDLERLRRLVVYLERYRKAEGAATER
jgi:hypothetical protein